MSVFSWASGIAIATATFALVGGSVATELAQYGAMSNESASIYAHQSAMLAASGNYEADLTSIPISAANDHTITVSAAAYAVVTQIPSGDIYLSTSAAPNPVKVESASIQSVALPPSIDASSINSSITGYEANSIAEESAFDRFKREAGAVIASLLISITPESFSS